MNNIKKITLNISGMHCESCAKIIEMELGDQAGIDNVKVDYKEHSAIIEYNQDKIPVEKIIDVIIGLGYQAKGI